MHIVFCQIIKHITRFTSNSILEYTCPQTVVICIFYIAQVFASPVHTCDPRAWQAEVKPGKSSAILNYLLKLSHKLQNFPHDIKLPVIENLL